MNLIENENINYYQQILLVIFYSIAEKLTVLLTFIEKNIGYTKIKNTISNCNENYFKINIYIRRVK